MIVTWLGIALLILGLLLGALCLADYTLYIRLSNLRASEGYYMIWARSREHRVAYRPFGALYLWVRHRGFSDTGPNARVQPPPECAERTEGTLPAPAGKAVGCNAPLRQDERHE